MTWELPCKLGVISGPPGIAPALSARRSPCSSSMPAGPAPHGSPPPAHQNAGFHQPVPADRPASPATPYQLPMQTPTSTSITSSPRFSSGRTIPWKCRCRSSCRQGPSADTSSTWRCCGRAVRVTPRSAPSLTPLCCSSGVQGWGGRELQHSCNTAATRPPQEQCTSSMSISAL